MDRHRVGSDRVIPKIVDRLKKKKGKGSGFI